MMLFDANIIVPLIQHEDQKPFLQDGKLDP